MTADADAQADASEREGTRADEDAQADEREDRPEKSNGDEDRPKESNEREDSVERASETDPHRARQDEPMSETNTDTDLPDESATDLAIRRNLYRAALALFALLAVVAVIQLYGSVNQTINTFVAQEYRSLFRAAFNLVVLLMAGIGISWCVRELSGE